MILRTLCFLFLLPALALAYATGPEPRRTGAPGDRTCLDSGCHSGTLIPNSSAITLTFPNGFTYTPGATQHVTLTASDPTALDYGFQLTARLNSDPQNGQAGDLTATDSVHPTLVLCDLPDGFIKPASGCPASEPVQFLEHTAFALPVNPTGVWHFDWTPPATNAGNVTFYVAVNASPTTADTQFGKHIHTAGFTLVPQTGQAPSIGTGGVLNTASGTPAIGPNAYVSIYGSNLSTTSPGRTWSAADLAYGLPLALDGTSVTIDGKAAYVEYVSPGQVNVIAPPDTAFGTVPVQVTVNGQASNIAMVMLQAVAPAFFTFNGKYLAATHADGTLIGPVGLFPGTPPNFTTPAKAGETIVLYGNGFGPTNPAAPAGQPTPVFLPFVTNPVITVGGVPAAAVGGLIAPYAALYQINVTLPASAPSGDLPVAGTAGGVSLPGSSGCCFVTVQN
ncbi:MAG TPA: hypothetical protein DEQ47_07600 [Solibacterales bacterium]|nr:hypothetical protein [Bryobacterales bacterium]